MYFDLVPIDALALLSQFLGLTFDVNEREVERPFLLEERSPKKVSQLEVDPTT